MIQSMINADGSSPGLMHRNDQLRQDCTVPRAFPEPFLAGRIADEDGQGWMNRNGGSVAQPGIVGGMIQRGEGRGRRGPQYGRKAAREQADAQCLQRIRREEQAPRILSIHHAPNGGLTRRARLGSLVLGGL